MTNAQNECDSTSYVFVIENEYTVRIAQYTSTADYKLFDERQKKP